MVVKDPDGTRRVVAAPWPGKVHVVYMDVTNRSRASIIVRHGPATLTVEARSEIAEAWFMKREPGAYAIVKSKADNAHRDQGVPANSTGFGVYSIQLPENKGVEVYVYWSPVGRYGDPAVTAGWTCFRLECDIKRALAKPYSHVGRLACALMAHLNETIKLCGNDDRGFHGWDAPPKNN